MAIRYALYFTPDPNSAWSQLWADWLGRDAFTGLQRPQPAIAGVQAAQFRALTAAPRSYGLHATLKAPFRLAQGVSLSELERSLVHYCARQQPFFLPKLVVRKVDNFIALTPQFDHAPISRVAAECVQEFDRFRAPASAEETARRLRAPLSAREIVLLDRWGYPYVMDCFQFHLSLTGELNGTDPQIVTAIYQAAQQIASDLGDQVLQFDAVCVFAQATANQDFTVHLRVPFGR